MGDYALDDKIIKVFEENKIQYYKLYEVGSEEFFDAMAEMKTSGGEFTAFVEKHTAYEYAEMKTYLTRDRTAGVAIEKDGNIVSVFNFGEKKYLSRTLIPFAIHKGGKKLDNYNSNKLSAMYAMYGFIPISKTKFKAEFAPPSWNFSEHKTPDIVFWKHNGDSVAEVLKKIGTYEIDINSAQEFVSYKQACKYRDEQMK